MYLIEVIPIAPFFGSGTLTYFYKDPLPKGSLVRAPLRNKKVPAVVISSKNVKDSKSTLRKGDFAIKKIGEMIEAPLLLECLSEASLKTARMHATRPGPILDTIFPKYLLDLDLLQKKTGGSASKKARNPKSRTRLVEGSFKKRIQYYAKEIERNLSKNKSAFLICPSTVDSINMFGALSELLSKEPLIFHSKLSKKNAREEISKIIDISKPICVIGTYASLSLVRQDTGLVILDSESDSAFRTMKRPFFDVRDFAKFTAECLGSEILLGDEFLSIETRANEKSDFKEMGSELKAKVIVSNLQVIKDDEKKTEPPAAFIGHELQEVIEENKDSKIFIFCPRRGLAGIVSCQDCGQTVACNNCQAPVTLHSSKKEDLNVFICHACGEKRTAAERCKSCDSWNLKALGLGIDGIEKDLKKLFPKTSIFKISKDATSTESKIKKEISAWEEIGGVLIGTQMALPYIKDTDFSVFASLDAQLAIPSLQSREDVFRLSINLLEKTKRSLIIQTRDPNNPLIAIIESQDKRSFVKDETEARKKFGYPPFKTLIKISIPQKVSKEKNRLSEILKRYSPIIYQTNPRKGTKQKMWNLLIKIDSSQWPMPDLISILVSLPMHIRSETNPRELF